MDFEIKQNEEASDIEWMNWYDGIKVEGDSFSLDLSKVSINEERKAVYLIGEEQATSVYVEHHPNAKFKESTPHGMRVINAFARYFKLTGTIESEALLTLITDKIAEEDSSLTVKAEKTAKGLLWTVV